MLTPQELKAVDEFKKRVVQALGDEVLSFTLFGSRARQEGDEESDVDLLVLLRDETNERRCKVIDAASDILLEYGIDISPFVISQKHFQELKDRELLIAEEIERDGIAL